MKGGEWAKSLKDKVFHFRGSLTTVLNYVSIIRPNQKVFLVGTDFNNSLYFFEEEIHKLDFKWGDFTSEMVKEQDKHFSVINYKGTTMLDKFDFIVNSLKMTGNDLVS